jgi:hypothetical protein
MVAAAAASLLAWVLLAGPVRADPQVDAPGVPPVEILNPDVQARLAVQFLSTAEGEDGHHAFQACDFPYIKFFSFYGTPPERLPVDRLLLNWWLHQLSFEQARNLPREVPGSKGRLVWIDIRDYGWTPGACQAVFEREPYCTEPEAIGHEHAEFLRRAGGLVNSKQALRRDTFHNLGLVRADWFMRETAESDRSPSYYDLLFARFRFPEPVQRTITKVEREPYEVEIKEDWAGGVDPNDNKYYPPGKYTRKVTKYRDVERKLVVADTSPQRDFPQDINDWEKAFGIDLVKAFARDTKVDLDYGSIVDGGADFPKSGSMVSLHNRLIVSLEGPYGANMRTFDVFDTVGLRDFSEVLIFKGKRGFVKGSGAQAVFDAGELLSYLPNGGQAALLINGEGKRAEIAATKAANETTDHRMNPGVRNAGSCVICHASAGGFIVPQNIVRDFLDAGGDVRFRDREKRNRVKGFLEGWQKKVKGYQDPYLDLIAYCTKDGRENPWTGAQLAQNWQSLRDWYDDPVDFERAQAEVGVPKAVLERLCRKSTRFRTTGLVKGRAVPRRTWESDVYPDIQLIRAAEVAAAEKRLPAPKKVE